MEKKYRLAWEDKKLPKILGKPQHPDFQEMIQKHLKMIFWMDRKLRRITDPHQEHHWPFGYFDSYLVDVFNFCLHTWEPERSSLSNWFYRISRQNVYREFLQYESESWHRFVDRRNLLPDEEHQTQANYTYHEGEFVLYRIPDPDDDWAEEILSSFPTREAAWDFLTKPLRTREKNILQRRFYHGHTLEEIALDEKISRQRVLQIQEEALRRLRRRVHEAEGLKDFLQAMHIDLPQVSKADMKPIKLSLIRHKLRGGL